jgi:hypothetical protein
MFRFALATLLVALVQAKTPDNVSSRLMVHVSYWSPHSSLWRFARSMVAAEKAQILTGNPVAGVLHPTYVTRWERHEVKISSKIGYLPPPMRYHDILEAY